MARRTNKTSSSVGPFLIGMAAGSVVGAAIALLYAPSEGSDLRSAIEEKFDEMTENVNKIFSHAKTSAEKMLNEGKDRGDAIVDSAREKAENLIKDADRSIHDARRRGSASAEDISHITSNSASASKTSSTATGNANGGAVGTDSKNGTSGKQDPNTTSTNG